MTKKTSLYETHLDTWKLANKFTSNSLVAKKLRQFIDENLINEEIHYQISGYKKVRPMFQLAEARNGKQAAYIHPDDLPEFRRRFKDLLTQKALELEEKEPLFPMRSFIRSLALKDTFSVPLTQFILSTCAHETYLTKDNDGQVVSKPIFVISSRGFIQIEKKGVPTFLRKYKKELMALGIKGIDTLSLNLKTQNPTRLGFLTPYELARHLRIKDAIVKERFFKAIETHFSTLMVEKEGQEIPLFTPFWKGQIVYHLKKEDIPLFLKKAQSELLQIGISPNVIDVLMDGNVLSGKNKSYISCKDLCRLMHSNWPEFKKLYEEINTHHLNDTYPVKTKNGVMEKPIFILALRKSEQDHKLIPLFTSMEALIYFTRKNKDLFLKSGFSLYKIYHLLKKEDPSNMPGETIEISELIKQNIFTRKHISRLIKLMQQSFTTPLENGEVLTRPLVFLKNPNNSKRPKLSIFKEALPILLSKYQKELVISPVVVEAYRLNKNIVPKTDDMISFTTLSSLLRKVKEFKDVLETLAKKECLYETYQTASKKQEMISYAVTKNGCVSLYIRGGALVPFLNKYKQQLISLRVRPKAIDSLIQRALNPLFAVKISENIKTINKIKYAQRKQLEKA